jgi:hypothetical protein
MMRFELRDVDGRVLGVVDYDEPSCGTPEIVVWNGMVFAWIDDPTKGHFASAVYRRKALTWFVPANYGVLGRERQWGDHPGSRLVPVPPRRPKETEG